MLLTPGFLLSRPRLKKAPSGTVPDAFTEAKWEVVSTLFEPSDIFATGDIGGFYDASNRSNNFSDLSGSVNAEPGNAVARANDGTENLFHALQSVSAARPILARVPEGGRRNELPNNRLDGAAVGVLGGGGALPDGWDLTSGFDLVEVVSVHEVNGFPAISLRLVSDNSAGSSSIFPRLRPLVSTGVPYATGQAWVGSVFARRVSGSNGAGFILNAANAAGNFAASLGSTAFLSSTLQRLEVTGSTENTNAVGVRVELGPNVSAGEVFDATIELSMPQLELGTTATAPQLVGASGFDVTEPGKSEKWFLQDLGGDSLVADLPDLGSSATIARATENGVDILENQSIASGPLNILAGEKTFAFFVIDRALTPNEKQKLNSYLEGLLP